MRHHLACKHYARTDECIIYLFFVFILCCFLFFAVFYVIGPATPPPGLSERPCGTPKPVSAPTETTWPTGPDTRNLLSFKPREQCNGALQEIQRPDVALICLWREVGRKTSGRSHGWGRGAQVEEPPSITWGRVTHEVAKYWFGHTQYPSNAPTTTNTAGGRHLAESAADGRDEVLRVAVPQDALVEVEALGEGVGG